jgi:flagellar motor switch protein FliN/FliY
MENQNNKTAVRAFAAAFAGALSESLGRVTGASWPLEVMNVQEPPSRKAPPLQFRLKVDGGVRGECFIEFYEPQASELVAKLSNVEAAGAPTDDPGKALAAVIASATTTLSTSLASQYGELAFQVDCVTGLAFGGMFVVALSAPADRPGATILLYFDGELLDALSSTAAEEDPADSAKGPVHPANLKLVMDVELNVSLRFGQRQLPLREVLELASGSVIELDRMVDEPVELLLDGKLVARGEAVIVDGNYGLRVTEIPQAMETHFLR